MKSPAAIPLFGDAYLADTTHLTTEEHGAYLLLMIAAWRQPDCDLPNDDKKLARIAGLSARKWGAIKDTILEFWTLENGRIFQPRHLFIPLPSRHIPKAIRDAVVKRDGLVCQYCRDDLTEFQLDHVYPFSKGGETTVENLVVACAPCNRKKSDALPQEWMV